MDGQPIPLDHGYPLRLVVPGHIGVRNAKWVCRLEISDKEAPSAPHQRDYRWVKEKDATKIDYSKLDPIMTVPLNSCITAPESGHVVHTGETKFLDLKGYAVPDGSTGAQVTKVEVSLDQGQTW
mmetsp:Transcript_11500/g.17309  ORF Transcript_11500/g.17309 Transcript_11500/m.17309 type:complete len:124 (+) Transcript_11500:1208-1579(+)